MGHFCPQCYSKKFTTVRLRQVEGEEYVCTIDPSHKFIVGIDVFPKLKK